LAKINTASGWGLICAFSIAVSWVIVFWINPAFLTDTNVKEQVITEYPTALLLWYLLDWVIFGIAAALFSFAVTDLFSKHFSLKLLLINLASISFAAYCIAVGLTEILAVLTQISLSEKEKHLQFKAFTALLQKLRGSTEFSGDIWLILLNLWLFSKKRVNRVITGAGVANGSLGILILFYPRYALVVFYVTLNLLWFLSMSIHLLLSGKPKTQVE
tara:strand:+ start:2642 stop:3289 length:648 start_codon:yes stop_codon:yes gene_type:complete